MDKVLRPVKHDYKNKMIFAIYDSYLDVLLIALDQSSSSELV